MGGRDLKCRLDYKGCRKFIHYETVHRFTPLKLFNMAQPKTINVGTFLHFCKTQTRILTEVSVKAKSLLFFLVFFFAVSHLYFCIMSKC